MSSLNDQSGIGRHQHNELRRLSAMHQAGQITDEQYHRKRKRILAAAAALAATSRGADGLASTQAIKVEKSLNPMILKGALAAILVAVLAQVGWVVSRKVIDYQAALPPQQTDPAPAPGSPGSPAPGSPGSPGSSGDSGDPIARIDAGMTATLSTPRPDPPESLPQSPPQLSAQSPPESSPQLSTESSADRRHDGSIAQVDPSAIKSLSPDDFVPPSSDPPPAQQQQPVWPSAVPSPPVSDAEEPALPPLVLDWPVPHRDYRPEASHPFTRWCAIIKRAREGRMTALIGVQVGPEAQDLDDPAYLDYRDDLRRDFRRRITAKAHHLSFAAVPGSLRVGRVMAERYTGSDARSNDVAVLVTTVQDQYCFAYFFAGPNLMLATFNQTVGQASPHNPNAPPQTPQTPTPETAETSPAGEADDGGAE